MKENGGEIEHKYVGISMYIPIVIQSITISHYIQYIIIYTIQYHYSLALPLMVRC